MAKHLPIHVDIVGNDLATDPISRAMRRISSHAHALRKEAGQMFGSFARGAAVAGAAMVAGGYALSRYALEWASAADELAKQSRQLGLGVESLQQYQYAAGLAGVNQETLTKSLGQFSRRLGEARLGQGSMRTFLRQVSPSLLKATVSAKTTDAAFLGIMTAMDKIKDPAKRAAFAYQVFGKSGLDMTRLVAGGIEDLRKGMDEARSKGLISAESAANAEQFSDNLDRLKASARGVGNTLMERLTPQIDKLAVAATEWLDTNRDLVALDVGKWIEGIGTAAQVAWDILQPFLDGLKATAELWQGMLEAQDEATGSRLSGRSQRIDAIHEERKAEATLAKHYTEQQVAMAVSGLTKEEISAAGGKQRAALEKLVGPGARKVAAEKVKLETETRTILGVGEPENLPRVIPFPVPGQPGQKTEVGGSVTVRFEGLPEGARVSEIRATNQGVPLRVDVGRRRIGGAP